MAAIIVEEDERLDDAEEVSQLEPEEATQEEPKEEVTEELPEKYQGKSVEDIVRMHQEAEKLLGRQSSEVGELRKVVDSYIQTQLSQEAPKTEEVDELDFFDDPQAAVNKAIENHPKVREAEQQSHQFRQQEVLSRLKADYPDFMDIVQDSSFQEWVRGSRIRTQLYAQADQSYDYDAAAELLDNWKERKATVERTVEAEKQSRKQAVNEASTGNVRGTGESSKKVYRRSDIIKLMKTDPERYAALSDEIMKAYAEGRVK